MPSYLIEVEESTLTTYRIQAKDKESAKSIALTGGGVEVEEHQQSSVHSCIEEVED